MQQLITEDEKLRKELKERYSREGKIFVIVQYISIAK